MPQTRKSPIETFRSRQKRQGIVRVEVQVRQEDAPIVRGLAKALADPARADQARALFKAPFAAPQARGLKALLAAAPLDGIDLERPRDLGRDVDW